MGYVAYADCLPQDGSVVVVLNNREDLEIIEVVERLAVAARSE